MPAHPADHAADRCRGADRRREQDPDRGWFVVLRLYSPLQPFFDKTWRAGEIEPVS